MDAGVGAVPWRPEMFDRRRDAVAVHEEMSGVTETMLSVTGAGDPADGPDHLPEVLSALSGLDSLETSPASEHVAVYESIHRSLQAVLEEPEQG